MKYNKLGERLNHHNRRKEYAWVNRRIETGNIIPLKTPTEKMPIKRDNYPYMLKLPCFCILTNAKLWVHNKTTSYKQRVFVQILNPMTKKWNYKKSYPFEDIITFYKNKETDTKYWTYINLKTDSKNDIDDFISVFGKVLNKYQKRTITIFINNEKEQKNKVKDKMKQEHIQKETIKLLRRWVEEIK